VTVVREASDRFPGGTRLREGDVAVDTPYSQAFLDRLAPFRPGRDLLDEILRSEHPPYIAERMRLLVEPFQGRERWRVLDFGCGAGASAVVLARLGIGRIVGVDLVNDYAAIWRQRLAEAGHQGAGTFVQAGESYRLPFRPGTFDAVFLNGVLEHLLPEERVLILREAFRLLATGGVLFVSETPNPLFPRNSHTKLVGSELLPRPLAGWLAARFGPRRDFPTRGRVAQYRTGMRGMTLGRMRAILGPGVEVIHPNARLAELEFTLPRNPLQSSGGRSRAGAFLWSIVSAVAKRTGTPPGVLAPHVNVAFRKRRERSEA
jgi:SAM-dependent methyltransferase